MKKAFTLLELVFVIVVIGIIAAVVIPRQQDNNLEEAAIQVISHIRYTQHLAMVDDRYGQTFGANNNWFMSRWQIQFHNDNNGNNDEVYSIYSDVDLDAGASADANANELAIDPVSGREMTGNINLNRVPNMNLTDTYGIETVILNGAGCPGGQRIFFDHLGRPHINNTLHQDVMTDQCVISLCSVTNCALAAADEIVNIAIEEETGYACIWDMNTGQCI
ncbi:MAG: prepilin-type N-terminal cleavage/methylation domain-containing protein [Sulfurimonas sp.]|nr:prepilin-type N-terminal cleavage/methylation domain-containing protein [Sulfurimonas sp.]PHQ92282.1 MAG: type II/IV secretion system protein [Sulfurimonas sp.]